MNNRFMRFVWLALPVLVLVGCDRAAETTEIHPDASISRTVVFTHQSMDLGGDTKAPKVGDLIEFNGPGWSQHTSKKDNADVITARRDLTAGADTPDYVLKDAKGPLAKCEISSVKQDDGTIKYTETVTWIGPKPVEKDSDKKAKSDERKALDEALDGFGADQPKKDSVFNRLNQGMIQIMFGPTRPIFGDLITQPERAESEVKLLTYRRLKAILMDEFQGADPGKLDAAARQIIKTIEPSSSFKAKVPKADPTATDNSDNSGLDLIDSEVKFPGTLVSTDGEVNELDNSVHWTFYAEAATYGQVILHAVVKP